MRSIAFIAVLLSLVACEPKPTACLDMPELFPAAQPIKFTSCSEDYDFLTWEFGTGDGIEGESPTFRYEFEGKFEVRLTAYSDGAYKSDEASSTHYVSFKYLDRFELSGSFDMRDTLLTFSLEGEDFDLLIEPGTYSEDDPIVLQAFEDRIRLTEGSKNYGVESPNTGVIVSGNADFTRFDQSFSETSSLTSNRTLRVYWRYKPLSEFN